MSQRSYGRVTSDGFIAFGKELARDDWALIDTSPYEGPNRTAAKAICDAPAAVTWKLQIAWVIGAIIDIHDGAGAAKDLDRAWDSSEKRFAGLVGVAAADDNGEKRAAAARIQKMLLLGAGEGQTNLSYQQEIDFGRKQVASAAQGQMGADIALLGLTNAIADIAKATDALAVAIGYGQGANRPSERMRAATAACAATFAAVSEQLAWAAANGAVGEDRERAVRLGATLLALWSRYPAETTHAAPAPEPEPPV